MVARNVRQLILERGLRHEEVAQRMRSYGFDWSANKVAQLLTLRRSVSLEEALGLCAAFAVKLDQLLAGDDLIEPRAGWSAPVPLSGLREVARTGRMTVPADAETVALHRPSEADEDTARRLGIDTPTLAVLSQRLFGTADVGQVRDQRAGDLTGLDPNAARAKRGHAMRAVLAELRECLSAQQPKGRKGKAQ